MPRTQRRAYTGSNLPVLSPADRSILAEGAASWVANAYAARTEQRLRAALAHRSWRERWSQVWPDRDRHPEEVAEISESYAEAAGFVLDHLVEPEPGVVDALRRVIAEATDPRTVDGDPSGR